MASPKTLRDVLPVFQTPFHTDESVDFATLEKEIDWLYGRGAHGIVMGMVSETLRLSADERKAVAARVCAASNGRGPVVISAGAESTRVAVEFAKHAESVGADAVMVIPPISVAVGENELLAYYEAIIGSISIPVVVQDASGYVGRPMSIAMQAALFTKHGQRVCFKPEATPLGPRLSALREAAGPNALIFEGSGGVALVDNYARGVQGSMPGADLVDAIVALWRALQLGDQARIDVLSPLITALNSMQHSLDAYLAVEKHLLVKQGVFKNTVVRGPTGFALDAHTRTEVDRIFGLMRRAAA